MEIFLGLGDYIVTRDPADVIRTYALASCMGITVYSAKRKVAGMAHIVLPHCPEGVAKKEKPGYYATECVPLLFEGMRREGCSPQELCIRLYGCAAPFRETDFFHIGRRNLETTLALLQRLGLRCHSSHVGGRVSRSLTMSVATGEVKVSTLPILLRY